ncbi:hypothetical protein [Desulfosporosinus nitroreducens]|uniref:hypothetical protein n=1 Tax=Desulfosporosinus nitroreducens TaxID=2018668 RepID=UPI00207CE46D|nr:hypothetical protein [Desulfosporosinus nitroreducens]MCO1600944.1 hypothetical protein [Desulfosporosinus nitroreducens]
MKFAKILMSIIVVLTLSGCGIFNSQSPVTTNSQTPPPESQASDSQEQQEQTAPISPTLSTDVSVSWIGVDQDVLGPNDLTLDTKPDGHFHVTLPFGQPSAVKSIWIRYSEFGKSLKWGWIYNKNLPLNGYALAVLDNSGKAVLPQSDNGYRVDGLTDFDLYLSELENQNGRDTLKFEEGQTFNLEIDYVTQNNVEQQFNSLVKITATK